MLCVSAFVPVRDLLGKEIRVRRVGDHDRGFFLVRARGAAQHAVGARHEKYVPGARRVGDDDQNRLRAARLVSLHVQKSAGLQRLKSEAADGRRSAGRYRVPPPCGETGCGAAGFGAVGLVAARAGAVPSFFNSSFATARSVASATPGGQSSTAA